MVERTRAGEAVTLGVAVRRKLAELERLVEQAPVTVLNPGRASERARIGAGLALGVDDRPPAHRYGGPPGTEWAPNRCPKPPELPETFAAPRGVLRICKGSVPLTYVNSAEATGGVGKVGLQWPTAMCATLPPQPNLRLWRIGCESRSQAEVDARHSPSSSTGRPMMPMSPSGCWPNGKIARATSGPLPIERIGLLTRSMARPQLPPRNPPAAAPRVQQLCGQSLDAISTGSRDRRAASYEPPPRSHLDRPRSALTRRVLE